MRLMLPFMCLTSPFMCLMLPFMCQMLPFLCLMLPSACPALHFICPALPDLAFDSTVQLPYVAPFPPLICFSQLLPLGHATSSASGSMANSASASLLCMPIGLRMSALRLVLPCRVMPCLAQPRSLCSSALSCSAGAAAVPTSFQTQNTLLTSIKQVLGLVSSPKPEVLSGPFGIAGNGGAGC